MFVIYVFIPMGEIFFFPVGGAGVGDACRRLAGAGPQGAKGRTPPPLGEDAPGPGPGR